MKIFIYALTGLTVTQGGAAALNLVDISPKMDKMSEKQQADFKEYEAMNRAALTFGTKIRQSYFDGKTGYTTWSGTGTDKDSKNYLYRTKLNSSLSGPTQEVAYTNTTRKNETKPIDFLNKTIFFGNDSASYYFDKSGISKFEWKNSSYSNYGLVGGLGGILGGVGGVLGGVGGILGGVIGLLVPNPPKKEPVTGEEIKPIEVYNRSVKDAVYNPEDDSITYSTLDDKNNDWIITKYYENDKTSEELASGTNNGLYPILAVEENSKDTYFTVNGMVSVYRDSSKKSELITHLSDTRQAYDVFVDSQGMYIGTSDSSDTSAQAHDNETIKKANPKTFYIDRINDSVTQDSQGDGYIKGVQWVNDMTKYVMYDSKTIVQSNSYQNSSYTIDGTYKNENLTQEYHTAPRYSGMFDYGVMYQADETYKIAGTKAQSTTGRAQVNRVFNDKFQETLRASNLVGSSGLDWNLGPNGEVYVWYNGEKKPNLTLSANSYISKVLLTEQDSEKPVQNGVVYNKTNDKNQFWEVQIPDAHAKNGYDLYVQFFDEDKQPNNVITSLIRLRPTDNAKINLADEKNSIKNEKKPSNNTKQSEILAALTKVTGTKITDNDVTINLDEKANYDKSGEIKIKANESSRLVMNQQTIEIPHLIYDISKTVFEPFNNDEKDYKNKIIKQIVNDSKIDDKIQLTEQQVTDETEISINQPQPGANGSITINAKPGATHLTGGQRIVIPARDAIDLSTLNFNDKVLTNNSSDKEIIDMVNEVIKSQNSTLTTLIEQNDIIIERKNPAKVGQDGFITIKASPSSVKISNSNTIKISKLKYDLTNFKIDDASNLIDKTEIIRRLNLITGLGNVNDSDFDFTLHQSSVSQTGIITIKATTNSQWLENEINITVPKTYNLAEQDLFKYTESNEQKEFVFYESTTIEDVIEYLQDKKGWKNITENDIKLNIVKQPSASEEGKIRIVSTNVLVVGSSITENNEQYVEVNVKVDRKNISEIVKSPIDIGRVDVSKIKGNTNEILIKSLKEVIMNASKEKINNQSIDYTQLHIKLIDRYNFEIAANQNSEAYSGAIQGSYYLQYDISNYKNDFSKGIFINEEDKNDLDKLKAALFSQYSNLFIYWGELKISIEDQTGNLVLEGNETKSLYSGKLIIKVNSNNNENAQSENNIPAHKKTKILLWVLAAVNIMAIAIAAVFVKNKKKDEE
ncbi:hypothetical protein MENTO_v1c04490 [Mesoplasma entomophilum]|uniref:Uncharacterized protein n=1 Tax=Mesoplasma entomophilum TaxID=2149 RepID=A0A3S5XZV8_9MOLU|nr:hypothetical protein [Mesoplasma entomophilum]ATQ35587.1 hypothetical protein CS528_02330 [Mesoplasma entomophilum]ATZ19554.1 hypothetical protein MENTO_v1c04490 [Mesoplasma entomophilum]